MYSLFCQNNHFNLYKEIEAKMIPMQLDIILKAPQEGQLLNISLVL